ncbi:MAG: choice-of-anchor P family protein, partial [bacterium]
MTSRRSQIFSTVAALVLLVVLQPPRASGQSFETTQTTFSGQATVIKGTLVGIPITLVDTGPVDAGGGALEAHLLCHPDEPDCVVGVPDPTNGVLTAEVLNATVVAQGNRSRATASVAELSLNVADQHISATLLQARADAQCADGTAFIRGDAAIADLVINGERIAVTGEVNQRIPLPGGGVVIINEQVASVSGGNGDVTVRALHILVPGILPGTDTDVVIAEAHADIQCGQRFCPADKDFVTGGGRLVNPSRNFAVAGGIKNGAPWGHLLYINHQTRVKAKGTGVTAYVVITDTTMRHIEGTAEINGQPGTYTVDVDDQGEPGTADAFNLQLSNREVASGTL